MYECYGCHKEYENEEEAKKCCTEIVYFDEYNFRLPRKMSRKPCSKLHSCPNVTHGDKQWHAWLEVDEKCPMCDYTYRPR